MSRESVLGRIGEEIVSRYLMRQGWEILDRNFRIPGGEIDIVARQGEEIAFVEVKTRTNAPGAGIEAVHPGKQRILIRAAYSWLHKRGIGEDEYYFRFDVAEVLCSDGRAVKLDYLENAFDVSDFSR